MNEKGILGRGESRSKEGKWSVRADQGKGEVGGGGRASRKHWVDKGKQWAWLLGGKWQGGGRTLVLEDRSTWPWLYVYQPWGEGVLLALHWWQQIYFCQQLPKLFQFSGIYTLPGSLKSWAVQPVTLQVANERAIAQGQAKPGEIPTMPLSPIFWTSFFFFLDLLLNALNKNIKMQGTKEPSPLGDMCICYNHYSYIHFIQSLSSSFMLGNVWEYKVSGFKLLSKLLIK